jgi:hypothetical protein
MTRTRQVFHSPMWCSVRIPATYTCESYEAMKLNLVFGASVGHHVPLTGGHICRDMMFQVERRTQGWYLGLYKYCCCEIKGSKSKTNPVTGREGPYVFPLRYDHLHMKKYSYPRNRPWRPIRVFPLRYEHLHMKKYSYPRNRPWRPIRVFPLRYEHLHMKKYSYLRNRPWRPIRVFPLRYEHLQMKK